MGGLAKIAKMYGGITIGGKHYVWDYVADVAVPEEEMQPGSARWIASLEARQKIVEKVMQSDAASNTSGEPK